MFRMENKKWEFFRISNNYVIYLTPLIGKRKINVKQLYTYDLFSGLFF